MVHEGTRGATGRYFFQPWTQNPHQLKDGEDQLKDGSLFG